jgi:transaldolase
VNGKVVDMLRVEFEDFRRRCGEDGLTRSEFDAFGPTRRTLWQFIAACHDVEVLMRDVMIPNPDV